jgi:hypothetical protein
MSSMAFLMHVGRKRREIDRYASDEITVEDHT